MKGILVTSDECTPCEEMKKTLGDFIREGEIEEVNFEKDPRRVTELINKYDANIPSLLILTDDDELILSL